MQGQFFGFNLKALPPWSQDLHDEEEFEFGKFKLKTLHTPGHTPGSCSFVADDILFSGDTLFQNSIGRTDLWGGDSQLIQSSIRDRLYSLDPDTRVICGHGADTKIGTERRTNPFVSI
jgi:glyoxylase-like metal-dependent hydrolase (beta-lactamase superfamily II)